MVSRGTVKIHVQHIISKLGVSDRTQAAVRAIEVRDTLADWGRVNPSPIPGVWLFGSSEDLGSVPSEPPEEPP